MQDAQRERSVHRALKELPPEQALLLQVLFFEERPHVTIARELGIPPAGNGGSKPMMILHHPEDEFLLLLAAGHLPAGQAVVVAAHVEECAQCGARLRTLQAVGGALLQNAEPHPLSPDSLAATLHRIADVPPEPARAPATPAPPPAATWLPAGVIWPASLRGCKVTPWRRIGPGRRFSRVQLPQDPEAALFLLRGRNLPRHRHSQLELTQVLRR
ncbi:transcriptional regulator [Ramlibacter henchirensis]|uniref:transcriptional regulator n=1 Tax=Ramlibacter henchirensis TaxID=204072 RepID=UPI0019806427|nr:transcriptional regulator [Ramlibacter henchirensis]